MKKRVEWSVEVSADFVVDERVCWDGPMVRVMPENPRALAYATAVDDAGHALAVGENGVELGAADRCVTVRVALGRAASELNDRDVATLRNGAVVASPDVWLWRPEPWPKGEDGALTLHTEAGMGASVPWPKRADGRFDVSMATWTMVSRTAFGPIASHDFDVDGARFTVSRLPGALHVSDAGIDAWLKSAADAVSLVDGHFPVKSAQIMVVPVDFGGRSVPFGMALRGGGPGAIILVSRGAHDDDLTGEWVSVHELSHLLIPPVKHTDAWLAEGLASYYQQLARGRAGLLTDAEAWGGLVDGFERGREDGPDEPLSWSSAHMGFPGAGYVRVYWGGAAILFELDVALRQKGRSLDELVAHVREREPIDATYRAADDVIAWFAADAPDVDVRGIVARGLASRFPDVDGELAALGVRLGKERRAVLDDDAKLASIRRAMMRAPASSGRPRDADAGASGGALGRQAASARSAGDTKPPNVVNSGR